MLAHPVHWPPSSGPVKTGALPGRKQGLCLLLLLPSPGAPQLSFQAVLVAHAQGERRQAGWSPLHSCSVNLRVLPAHCLTLPGQQHTGFNLSSYSNSKPSQTRAGRVSTHPLLWLLLQDCWSGKERQAAHQRRPCHLIRCPLASCDSLVCQSPTHVQESLSVLLQHAQGLGALCFVQGSAAQQAC